MRFTEILRESSQLVRINNSECDEVALQFSIPFGLRIFIDDAQDVSHIPSSWNTPSSVC